MRIRKNIFKFLIISSLLLLTGCGSRVRSMAEQNNIESDKLYEENFTTKYDKLYDRAYEKFLNPKEVEELEGTDVFDKVGRIVYREYRIGYKGLRVAGIIVVIISEIVGILLMMIGRNDDKMFKTGLFVYCIGIPAMTILLIIGIGVFNNLVLY